MLGSTTPGFALGSSTVGNLGDELVVTIGNGGLLPGQLVRFEIKLDVDPSFASTYAASFGDSRPDFRTVLFDMNGLNVYDGVVHSDTSDNSHAFVVFNPGGDSGVATFADEPVAAGQYYNNNLRAYKGMDPVLIFQLEGSQQIPEPASIGLAVFGLSAGLLFRRRSRLASLLQRHPGIEAWHRATAFVLPSATPTRRGAAELAAHNPPAAADTAAVAGANALPLVARGETARVERAGVRSRIAANSLVLRPACVASAVLAMSVSLAIHRWRCW